MASFATRLGTTRRRVAAMPVELPLFVFALVIRMLYLSSDPLWLDEFVIFEIGLGGPLAFFRVSTLTPHPPFYYLLQWAAAGFGHSNAETAWRWLPALCGALTIPLIYTLARHVASHRNALIAALLVAISPTHVFFSQEARPYAFVTLLAAINMLAFERAQRLGTQKAFSLVTALWIIGLSSSYSFSAVVVPQLLWIFAHRRNSPRSLSLVIGMMLFGAFLFALAYQPMLHIAQRAEASGTVLTLTNLTNMLFLLDPLRYGFLWGHAIIPGLLTIFIGVGAWYGIMVQRLPMAKLYSLQLLVPLAGVFIVLHSIIGMKMPVKDAKQFIVLLPAASGLLAAGFDCMSAGQMQRLGRIFTGLCVCIILSGYGVGLNRYWTTTKSPEGRVVQAVIQQQEQGDAFVVMHYSLSAAFSFYQPDTAYFSRHPQCNDAQLFAYTRFEGLMRALPDCTHRFTMITEAHQRIWLLSLMNSTADLQLVLGERCARRKVYMNAPFQALLYECHDDQGDREDDQGQKL